MTQQINLFEREVEERLGPLLTTIAAGAVTAILCLAYWQYLVGETKRLEKQLAQTNAQVASHQAAIKSMKDALAQRTDPARLAAELASVKARASEAQEFLAMIHRGELGSLEGYGGQFATLARVGEPGVWLTGVKIHSAGHTLEIEGRSLQAEAVLRYAGEFNRRFASYGATLSSVELTPVVASDKAATAVSFKLF